MSNVQYELINEKNIWKYKNVVHIWDVNTVISEVRSVIVYLNNKIIYVYLVLKCVIGNEIFMLGKRTYIMIMSDLAAHQNIKLTIYWCIE